MDDLQTIYSTDTHTVFAVSATGQPGGQPVSQVGAVTVTARFRLVSAGPSGTGVSGTGVGTVPTGTFNYKPSPADLAQTPGVYSVQLTVGYSDGTTLPLPWFDFILAQAI